MIPFTHLVRFVAVASLAALATACVVRSERNDPGGGGGVVGGTPTDGPAGSAAAPTPILVQIDTGKTMSADPGDGVGIFTEYKAGGHWHVWWTCDTNKTGQACAFSMRVSGSTMTAVHQDAPLEGDTAILTKPDQLDLSALTTKNVAGVTFDTAPGDTIQLEALVGGVADPSFFFFVQDGKVNGGYAGKLTNPLLFQGSTP